MCMAESNESNRYAQSLDKEAHIYRTFDSVPINIEINKLANAQFTTNAQTRKGNKWFNIAYPQYGAMVYCTIVPVTKDNLNKEIKNRWQRIMLNANMGKPSSVIFEDSINNISAEMFFSPETSITPVQFMATDSATFLFSGALNFQERIINADSIRPIINYISEDIGYMLQNLKKSK